jgi:hypothetical protein
MLNAYLAATEALLQLPPAPATLYSPTLLTQFINTARGQLAGEAKCVVFKGTMPLVQGTQEYPFSGVLASIPATQGISSIINVEQILLVLGTGYIKLRPRPWPWFTQYWLNNAAPQQGQPQVWAQYAQGANGSVLFGPVPNYAYTALFDSTCLPIPLVDDTTVEAIPPLWTDAVPYFAAYLALLSAQSAQRQGDANRMFERYKEFVNRARDAATPTILPGQYKQQPNLTRPNQLGVRTGRGAGG